MVRMMWSNCAAILLLTASCGGIPAGTAASSEAAPKGPEVSASAPSAAPPPAPAAASPSPRPLVSPSVSPLVPTSPPAATPEPAPAPPGPRAADPGRAPALTDVVIQSGLSVPWDLVFAPDGRMFVTERAGNVLIFASGAPGAARLANVAIAQVVQNGESGLLGIALDPDFATNGLLYLCATRNDGGTQNQILRYRTSGNALALDTVLVRGMRAAGNHDGCRLHFGPDGKLWATMGDAGNTALAQDPNGLNGKILRLNTDGSVPADNPILPGAQARTVAYSTGHRNPQGIDFQPGTGTPFAVEHGENDDDEVNVIRPGANYGWPITRQSGGAARGFVDPAWSSGSVTFATSGGAFVTGPAWGAWTGSLFVATLKDTTLRRLAVNGTSVTSAEVLYRGKYGRLRAVVRGPDGALYLTTSNRDGRGSPVGADDRIVRIAAGPS
ncbi:MAG: PQQ-dependent sugar dehydrogenase [Chloroflexi bacterium]|nr:PQQ-dependent sugar dehydrogenase [Chloroflexota bacterium]